MRDFPALRPHGNNLVPGLVECGANEVVHGRVGNHKGLLAIALHVKHARQQRSRLGDKETARLDEQAPFEIAKRVFERRGVLLHFGCGIESAGVIIDAEAAAGVDGLKNDAFAAELLHQLARRVQWPRRTESAERI